MNRNFKILLLSLATFQFVVRTDTEYNREKGIEKINNNKKITYHLCKFHNISFIFILTV